VKFNFKRCLYFFLSLLVLVGGISAQTFKRLDPHGSPEMNLMHASVQAENMCLICHSYDTGKKGEDIRTFEYNGHKMVFSLTTLPNAIERCSSCHSGMPHSGLVEHLGADLSKLKIGVKGKVDCLSCHRPHRAKIVTEEDKRKIAVRAKVPFVFKKRGNLTLPAGMIERRNSTAMLRRECVDCHTKDNLL